MNGYNNMQPGMMPQQPAAPQAIKKEKPHGIFVVTLWTTLVVFVLSILFTFLMLILTDVVNISMVVPIIIIPQVVWFGGICILLSYLSQKIVRVMGKIFSITGMILCVASLVIGIFQAFDLMHLTRDLDAPQWSISVLLYSCAFLSVLWLGRTKRTSLLIVKYLISAIFMAFAVIVIYLILNGLADSFLILARYYAIFVALMIGSSITVGLMSAFDPDFQKPPIQGPKITPLVNGVPAGPVPMGNGGVMYPQYMNQPMPMNNMYMNGMPMQNMPMQPGMMNPYMMQGMQMQPGMMNQMPAGEPMPMYGDQAVPPEEHHADKSHAKKPAEHHTEHKKKA